MEPGRICQACTLVVAVRNHMPVTKLCMEVERLTSKYQGCFLLLDTMNIDVSSQLLRQWCREHKSLRYYVPYSVISYIEENHIYHRGDEIEERSKKHGAI